MKADILNPAELRVAGCKALAEALGPVGMARFLRQFERGDGDYTRERKQWLGNATALSIGQRIRGRRKKR
jgi:hypothetical protein